jgi:hypothetical protein
MLDEIEENLRAEVNVLLSGVLRRVVAGGCRGSGSRWNP